MGYGDMSLNGKNVNKSVEGMHSIVFDILKELTKLEDENMIITECNVQLKFIEGAGIQEYQQIQDGTKHITINKTSLEELEKSIRQQKQLKPLILLLEKYSDPELFGWMTDQQFNIFATEFSSYHSTIFGILSDYKKDEPYDSFDINLILKNYKIPYSIRKINTGEKDMQ